MQMSAGPIVPWMGGKRRLAPHILPLFPDHTYEALAQAMRSMKGKAVLSINDVPQMRKVFAGLRIKRVRISYSVGRLRKARVARSELIVRSW